MEIKLFKDNILKKHSALIQISSKMTAQQRKIFNVLLMNSNVNKWDNNNLSVIEIKSIKKYLGITHKNNKFLKENLKKIQQIQVEYNLLEKDKEVWGNFSLIQEPEIRNGFLSYSLPYRIRQTIQDGKPPFALLDMEITSKLNNKFSIIIYELFVDYYSKKLKKLLLPKITVKQFRTLLGLEEIKYKALKDFKKYVMNRAIEELKLEVGLNIEYLIYKELGENYIKFEVEFKKDDKAKISNQEITDFLIKEKEIIERYKSFIDTDNKVVFKEYKSIKSDKLLIFEEDGYEIEIDFEEEYEKVLLLLKVT
jgi:hypothetical protein